MTGVRSWAGRRGEGVWEGGGKRMNVHVDLIRGRWYSYKGPRVNGFHVSLEEKVACNVTMEEITSLKTFYGVSTFFFSIAHPI